jgi:hypothetical protein
MNKSKYVYIKSEPNLYTVGFYRPDGGWEPESDWRRSEDAAEQVHYLNGGQREEQRESAMTPTTMTPKEIANTAIETFLEYTYRERTDQDEEARVCATNEVLERIKHQEEQQGYGVWHGKYRVDFIKDEQEQGIEI